MDLGFVVAGLAPVMVAADLRLEGKWEEWREKGKREG